MKIWRNRSYIFLSIISGILSLKEGDTHLLEAFYHRIEASWTAIYKEEKSKRVTPLPETAENEAGASAEAAEAADAAGVIGVNQEHAEPTYPPPPPQN